MMARATGLAIVFFVVLFAVVDVQGAGPSASESQSAGNGSSIATGQAAGGEASQALSGWYPVHATHCYVAFDGSRTWVYLFPSEGGYWYTDSPAFQNAILAACQTGNYVAFYVYDASGAWNQLFTYTYR